MARRSTQEICFLGLSSARSRRGAGSFNAKASEQRAGDQFLEVCVEAGLATLTDLSDSPHFLGASAAARGAGEADATWGLSILLSAARILGEGICTGIEHDGIVVPAAPASLDSLAQQALA